MRISLNWLKEYIDIPVSAKELAEQMTMLGLEIESVEEPGKEIEHVVVGQIVDIQPHPQADKLVVCKTDIGKGEPLQIICGAKNMKVGDRVPTALDGATLPGGIKITRRKMRGVESFGMMCSGAELKVEEDSEGLLILDKNAPIGEDIKKVLGLDDIIFEIEVTPNRGDWASYLGLARELSAFYNVPVKVPSFTIRESETPTDEVSSVTIECPELCPRYAGRVIRNVKIAPSPDWLAKKLLSAGQRPINNVVDITNFVLLECGHPLHAFDLNKLNEKRIVVRTARENEQITTLDGVSRTLCPPQMVIADAKVPQALAGIMGGADSEVDDNTVDLFIESAYFNPVSVRKTARYHGLLTEAAQHFQRGADPEIVLWALNRTTALIQELAGGEVLKGELDIYPNKIESKKVKLRCERTNKRLGVDVTKEKQVSILVGLGFKEVEASEKEITFIVPSWRHDVTREEDLIEEIARFYGYHNIPNTLPKIRQSYKVFDEDFRKIRKIRTLLVNKGLTECFSWTFSNREIMEQLQFPPEYLNMVALQNPLSKLYSTMRTSILPNLLQTAQKNHLEESLSIFEIGPVFFPKDNNALPDEPHRLGILISGYSKPKLWCFADNRKPFDFFDLKGLWEDIANQMNVIYDLKLSHFPLFHPGQSVEITSKNKLLGRFGKIHPKFAHVLEINENTYLGEFNLDAIFSLPEKKKQYEQISEFPESDRDIAILIDQNIPAMDIVNIIQPIGKIGEENIIKDICIFDVYTGEQVPKNKKSVAIRITFCSNFKTLTDAEIDDIMAKIINKICSSFNATIR